jgi:hypothetical protein
MLVMLFKEENVNVMAVNNLNVRIPENNKNLIIN